jgi:hypothetical protein
MSELGSPHATLGRLEATHADASVRSKGSAITTPNITRQPATCCEALRFAQLYRGNSERIGFGCHAQTLFF